MSDLSGILEDFGSPVPSKKDAAAAPGPVASVPSEQTYEAGYASGWDDALAKAAETRQKMDAEFQRNIEDLKFSYVEATAQIRNELHGFIDAILSTFLPALLPDLVVLHIRDLLRGASEELANRPLKIVASEDVHAHVAELVEETGAEFDVVCDTTLAAHQVFVRFGDEETMIDLLPVIDTVRDQFEAMQTPNAEEQRDVG